MHRAKSSDFAGCCRQGTRTAGLVLTRDERSWLLRSLGRSAECGRLPVSMRRLDLAAGRLVETRMTTLGHCGLRSCPECEEKARSYRAARAEGPWSMMTTLTLDHPTISLRRAWTKMPGWIGKFIRAMQRQAEKRSGGPVVTNKRTHELRNEWAVGMIDRGRAIPHVLYAWAIEPHKSGFPHVHIVHSCRYLSYSWARKTWAKITGMTRVNPDHKPLHQDTAHNKYLTKYITKAVMPLDLCAVTRRKRLFWSAMPLRWEPAAGWLRVKADTLAVARGVLDGHRDRSGENGWTDAATPSGEHMIQKRVWTDPTIEPLDTVTKTCHAPNTFDGSPGEWSELYVSARARALGLNTWRWWSDKLSPMVEEKRWQIVVTLGWALSRGQAFSLDGNWYGPERPAANPLAVALAAGAAGWLPRAA